MAMVIATAQVPPQPEALTGCQALAEGFGHLTAHNPHDSVRRRETEACGSIKLTFLWSHGVSSNQKAEEYNSSKYHDLSV